METVEKMVAAWNRRDLDALLSHTDAQVAYINQPTAVEPGTRLGHEALASVAQKQWEALGPAVRQKVDEAHPRGDDVITVGRISMEMPGSETRLEQRTVLRWRFRDGVLVSLEVLGAGPTFNQGLEAAGLSE